MIVYSAYDAQTSTVTCTWTIKNGTDRRRRATYPGPKTNSPPNCSISPPFSHTGIFTLIAFNTTMVIPPTVPCRTYPPFWASGPGSKDRRVIPIALYTLCSGSVYTAKGRLNISVKRSVKRRSCKRLRRTAVAFDHIMRTIGDDD